VRTVASPGVRVGRMQDAICARIFEHFMSSLVDRAVTERTYLRADRRWEHRSVFGRAPRAFLELFFASVTATGERASDASPAPAAEALEAFVRN